MRHLSGGGSFGSAPSEQGTAVEEGHWSQSHDYGNAAHDSMTISKGAFEKACREMQLASDLSAQLWLNMHKQCFLHGGEHFTSGVTPPRDDARNVNAWHWDNANLMPWTKERLRDLMVGLSVPGIAEGGWMRITSIKKCEGDCETNTRKGKTIVCFDFKLVLRWEAQVNYEDASGTISLPYIDNVETEDGHIRTEVAYEKDKTSPSCPSNIREIVDEDLVPMVQAQMRIFLKELWAKGTNPPQSGSTQSLGPSPDTKID
mmetsp:Transcript_4440/g.6290  ORF Transcript_4440/g.6290 Transcript_4440/m.6290 type:complete len:259 (-) Transcript_4440:223-999(-)